MDAGHFDALARTLTPANPRRRVLGVLATLPVLGSLVVLLDANETEAKDRRRRRKTRHDRRKHPGQRKHHKRKKCKAESVGQTCANRCGSVSNNCNQSVDCGSCACDPACDACFTCQDGGPTTLGTCVVDPAQQGQTYGLVGQICQADGSCACDAGSCANPTPICANGACVFCSATNPCPAGQCCAGDGSCGACLAFVTGTSSFGHLGGFPARTPRVRRGPSPPACPARTSPGCPTIPALPVPVSSRLLSPMCGRTARSSPTTGRI